MNVKKLIKELKKQSPELNVKMFAHDHNPADSEEGDGDVFSVSEVTNENGETFICLHA